MNCLILFSFSSVQSIFVFNIFIFADPIFSFSPLAIHTRNLLADPRCTLVVQVSYLVFCTVLGVPALVFYLSILLTARINRYLDGAAYPMQE